LQLVLASKNDPPRGAKSFLAQVGVPFIYIVISVKKWLYKRERYNLVVFYYFISSEFWPDGRGDLSR
jgi:hypothetical protein